MALYDKVPDIKPVKKAKRKSSLRSQMPGHPANDPHTLAEKPKALAAKKAAPPSKRQRAAESNRLDKTNKPTQVAGNGGTRDTLAQGARKAGTPTPKPNGNDKKVRGQGKK